MYSQKNVEHCIKQPCLCNTQLCIWWDHSRSPKMLSYYVISSSAKWVWMGNYAQSMRTVACSRLLQRFARNLPFSATSIRACTVFIAAFSLHAALPFFVASVIAIARDKGGWVHLESRGMTDGFTTRVFNVVGQRVGVQVISPQARL